MTLIRSCALPACSGGEPAPGSYVCDPCWARLVRQLGEIESYLDIVTAVPSRSGDFGPRRPGYASAPPLRLDVVAMLDPRTRINGDGPEDRIDEVPNIGEDLAGWWRVVQEERHYRLIAGGQGTLVTSEVATDLRTHVGWIAQQSWVDEFAADIGRVHAALRAACGDRPPKAFAKCPEVIDGTVCGGPIQQFADGTGAQCRTCRASWRRDQLLDLMLRTEVIHGRPQTS